MNEGDHSSWYAMAVGLIGVVAGLLGLRRKASADSVQRAEDAARVARIESAEEELQRLRQALQDCRTDRATLKSNNEYLRLQLMDAQFYANKYRHKVAKLAGTDFGDLHDLPKPRT